MNIHFQICLQFCLLRESELYHDLIYYVILIQFWKKINFHLYFKSFNNQYFINYLYFNILNPIKNFF